ncbi:MAG: type II toxin-antitoxin system Phd/YefM family antitoxin [Lachnospiraceae bacterium]|jgi:PHD/YefM family antitoxin component YafN of YafNO toxin-antitoxin module|nr:type II toxin-antitoxin system Phd/YefM family antitoxin [Lachnospiraceae bacterium]
MPQIIPIRDLKNTSEVSALCHKALEPIFITKNGYGDMVIMSMETFERNMYMQDIHTKIAQAKEPIAQGKLTDAHSSVKKAREKYELAKGDL